MVVRKSCVAPNAKLQSGLFHILVVRGANISRFRLALILLGLEHGTHVNMPCVEFIDCAAFRLVPTTTSNVGTSRQGKNVIDGVNG